MVSCSLHQKTELTDSKVKIMYIVKNILKPQMPSILVAAGHGGTHWVNAAIYILLPYIILDLGLSYTQAGLIMTVFHFSTFFANAISGPLVDLRGKEKYSNFQAYSLLIGGIAMVLLSMSSTIYSLFISVAMIGVCISLWHPAAITYLSVNYPENRGFVLSIHSIGASLGDALSPLLAAFFLTYVTINGSNLSWNTTSIFLSLPLFILVLIIIFFLNDKKNSNPEITGEKDDNYFADLKLLLLNIQLIPLFLVAGVRTVTQNGVLIFMPLYLVANEGASAAVIGASLFSMQMGGLISGPIAGYLSDRHGRKIIAISSLLVSGVLVPFYPLISSNILIILLSAVIGFAIYAGRPVVQGWALDIAPSKTSGSVISLLFMMQVGSAALFAIIAGIIADRYGLAIIFIILSAVCIITLVIASLIPASKTIKIS